jgi:hypothetical protein
MYYEDRICALERRLAYAGHCHAGAGVLLTGTIAGEARCRRRLRFFWSKDVMGGMAAENAVRLAVLIDADNAQPSITEALLAEVAKYGTAHVKRAYGDWTGTSLKGWKEHLLAQ